MFKVTQLKLGIACVSLLLMALIGMTWMAIETSNYGHILLIWVVGYLAFKVMFHTMRRRKRSPLEVAMIKQYEQLQAHASKVSNEKVQSRPTVMVFTDGGVG